MTKYQVTQDRKVYVNNKLHTFVKGKIKTASQVEKLFPGKPPSWLVPIKSGFQGLKETTNYHVDLHNSNPSNFTETEQQVNDKITTHLLGCGFKRDQFAFVKSFAEQGYPESETVWVGVKMDNDDDVFVGAQNKPISLQLQNFISTRTFLQRINKGEALFKHTQF